MTRNYLNAVLEAETVMTYSDPDPEQIVSIGYRAGLQDAVKALKEGGAVQPSSEGSRRLYAIVSDKIAAIARKFEEHAKSLGV